MGSHLNARRASCCYWPDAFTKRSWSSDNQTGEQIVVTPTGYRGNQVKIGIEASKDRFTILRREVHERDLAAAVT